LGLDLARFLDELDAADNPGMTAAVAIYRESLSGRAGGVASLIHKARAMPLLWNSLDEHLRREVPGAVLKRWLKEGTPDEPAPSVVLPALGRGRRWSKPYSWQQWGKWTTKGRSHTEDYFKAESIQYHVQGKGAVYVVLDDLHECIRQQLPE
jgi:hypothetical protein